MGVFSSSFVTMKKFRNSPNQVENFCTVLHNLFFLC